MATIHVSVRLDEATMARVDALRPHFSTHWRSATRSDILRVLIRVGLDRYAHELAPPPRHSLMRRWASSSGEKEPPAAGKAATAEPPERTPSNAGTRKR